MPHRGKSHRSPSLPIKNKSVPSATRASNRRTSRTLSPNSCPSRAMTKKSGCAGPCATAKSCRPTSAPPLTRSLPTPMKNRIRPSSATVSACANTPVPAARPAATMPTPNSWPRSAASSTKKKFPGRSGNWAGRPGRRRYHRLHHGRLGLRRRRLRRSHAQHARSLRNRRQSRCLQRLPGIQSIF